MLITEAIVKLFVAIGFRAPGEPSRKELRTKIAACVKEGEKHANEMPTQQERRERTGGIKLPPVTNGAH